MVNQLHAAYTDHVTRDGPRGIPISKAAPHYIKEFEVGNADLLVTIYS
jgi:hypothetical protein